MDKFIVNDKEYVNKNVDGFDCVYNDEDNLVIVHVPATKLNVSYVDKLSDEEFRDKYCNECSFYKDNFVQKPDFEDYFNSNSWDVITYFGIDYYDDNVYKLKSILRQNPLISEYLSEEIENYIEAYEDWLNVNEDSDAYECGGGIYKFFDDSCQLSEKDELNGNKLEYLEIEVLEHIIIYSPFSFYESVVNVYYLHEIIDNVKYYRTYMIPNNVSSHGCICLGENLQLNNPSPNELFNAVWGTSFTDSGNQKEIKNEGGLSNYLINCNNPDKQALRYKQSFVSNYDSFTLEKLISLYS